MQSRSGYPHQTSFHGSVPTSEIKLRAIIKLLTLSHVIPSDWLKYSLYDYNLLLPRNNVCSPSGLPLWQQVGRCTDFIFHQYALVAFQNMVCCRSHPIWLLTRVLVPFTSDEQMWVLYCHCFLGVIRRLRGNTTMPTFQEKAKSFHVFYH